MADQTPAQSATRQAAYRAVLDYCSGGIQGIGPFEAEEIVLLVEHAQRSSDWTIDPESGRSNSSERFEYLVGEVDRLIRSEGTALIHGNSAVVARLIVAQLAHQHGMAPTEADDGR